VDAQNSGRVMDPSWKGASDMNCSECARLGRDAAAVALCRHCSAGLCLAHVQDEALDGGPGGMNLSCKHHTWDPPHVDAPHPR
jgi:hypothetical protein